MPLKAIVFDFDGVIANSEPLHFRAFRDVLAPAGVTLTEHDYYTRYLGFSDADLFQMIGAEARPSWTRDRIDSMIDAKARLMERLEREGSVLFPGAADAVRRAAARVPLAIASGAIRPEIERTLAREQLFDFFTAIVAAGDTPQSKPSPEPYRLAVDRLSTAIGTRIHPGECVAIEDSQWGLQSAHDAGLRTVGVAHTYEVSGLGSADLTIRSINDLDLRTLAALISG